MALSWPSERTLKGTSLAAQIEEAMSVARQFTMTSTTVTLPAGVSTPIVAANPDRRFLAIKVQGTGNANLSVVGPATVDVGWSLEAASASGRSGEGYVFDASAVPTNAIVGISEAGTTIVVWEG